MRLLNLTELSLILMLMSYSRGQWTINTSHSSKVRKGSDLTINCTFTYPSEHRVEEIYWKTEGGSECSKGDDDENAFVYHPNSSCVLPNYKDKTKVIGDKAKGNCTLLISNIQDGNKIYLRVVTNKNQFSFVMYPVFISINGTGMAKNLQPVSSGVPLDISMPGFHGKINMYLMIFIPVAALLICVVAGTVACIRHRRSHTFPRKESGYYVNFNRAPSNPPASEASSKPLDKKPTEESAIDDPVYINFQTETNQTNQDTEHTDGIYANVDYSSPT